MNLIESLRLPNGRSAANLGFGCVGLLRIPFDGQRRRLLHCAVDLGITHFDVARMYGMGGAEGVMGSALKSRRDQITLATKFGIFSPVPDKWKVNLKYAARWLVGAHSGLQRWAKKAATGNYVRHNDYSIEAMECSLAISLRELQTGYIDLLFLHEPLAGDPIPDGLEDALRRKVDAGQIGGFGVSGHMADIEHFMQTRPGLCGEAVQYDYSIIKDGKSDVPLRHRALAGMFKVIEKTHARISEMLVRDHAFAKLWSNRLECDLADPETLGIVILAVALHMNKGGMVLFSTTKPKRLEQVVRRLRENSFTPENLLEFREAVSSRLSFPHAA